MDRFGHQLNNPRIVLAVGMFAVLLNVLLYFGVYVPRMVPAFGNLYAFGASIPEALGNPQPEAKGDSKSGADRLQADNASRSEVATNPEAGSDSGSGASSDLRLDARSESNSAGSSGSGSDSSTNLPAGSPPQSSASPEASASPQASVAADAASAPPQSSAPPDASAPPQSSAASPQIQYR